ncbi:MAG: hypothetical protein GTO53_12480 [Planctomycetales bacterium]|nr:hypothetical protein [Planctomycetales bacterium]NIM09919.1 hypothetical protein [Planctomycetales bacterium]NIN78467.1 hypothetical protein [Planctomycetales bacterium]NIO35658.1 hypothetical protein [Planctomycetales bacterium]NIO47405.1 hypothetical protein [Planctomycetales bacterium]
MTMNNFHIYIFRVREEPGEGEPQECQPGTRSGKKVDPFIARLIARLQREVRDERRSPWEARWRTRPRWTAPSGEMWPLSSDATLDFELPGRAPIWLRQEDADGE